MPRALACTLALALVFGGAACRRDRAPLAAAGEPSTGPDADARVSVVDLYPDVDPEQPLPPAVDPSQLRTLDGGVQVVDLEVGEGPTPVEGQEVSVAYSAWLQQGGRMFDSSVHFERDPLEMLFGRPGVIEGWHIALADMRPGGRRLAIVPAERAYGERRVGPVPPNATLVFELELTALGEIRVRPEQPSVAWTEPRVSTLAEGVRAVDLEPGSGAVVEDRSAIDLEMTLWNSEGEVVFSTADSGRIPRFLVGGPRQERPPLVGLGLGVLGMREGGIRYLELAPEVAFGELGKAPDVGPDEVVYAWIRPTEVSAPRVPPDRVSAYDPARLITSSSGLQYVDLEVGDGPVPQAGQVVQVEYTGWLEDGTRIDSSYEKRSPFTTVIGEGRLVAGWEEGLASMRVGGRRVLIVPKELGYEDRPYRRIPANSTLVYEVALVAIED